ncbi:hypothetical protein HDU96_005422 [Phlyctochytrium bullatum]|nr:hypothetical protein HDU96_005422 [Phlyctochytrium bullatum]
MDVPRRVYEPSTVTAPSTLQAELEADKKTEGIVPPQPAGSDENDDEGEVYNCSAGPVRLVGIEEIFDEKEGLFYEDETDRFMQDSDEDMDDLKRMFFSSRSWAFGLTRQAQFEWLVDCYRLHATQHKTGVHEKKTGDPEEFAKALANDFFRFCALATVMGVVPWYGANIWSKFLMVARQLLPEPLDDVAAWEKHQSEAIFSRKTRYGRSLPFTAQLVYENRPGHWVCNREEPCHEKIRTSAVDHPVELFQRVEFTVVMYKCGQVGVCSLCGRCNLCINTFVQYGGARMWKEFKLDLVADITGCSLEENVNTYVAV